MEPGGARAGNAESDLFRIHVRRWPMRESNKIEIIGIDDEKVVERIHSQLRSLILSRERTIPGSRSFGLKGKFMDMLSPEAVNEFAIELEEKTEEFIPEISIAEVRAEQNVGSTARIQINVDRREGL